jgi:HTH-type transcriptional regulator/antitoxin MqsA
MQEFKKEVDGLLTGKEIKELRSRFRITQAQAAKIFGGGPVAFSKYEADDVSQSEPMDKLLRVALSVPGAFAWLSKEAGEMTPCIQAMSESLKQIQNVSKQSYRTSMSNSSFNKPTLSGSSNSPYRSSTGVEDLLEVA